MLFFQTYLNHNNNIVLASSHDIELTEDIEFESYQLYHFSESINKHNELFFDYKLRFGPFKTRNAIKILELYGYPMEIINEANKIYDVEEVIPSIYLASELSRTKIN